MSVEVAGEELSGRRVLAGVPHYVLFVEDADRAPLDVWGPALRRDRRFGPDGTNVDVVSIDERGAAHVRTWERGVEGETLACGTGAVATAFAMLLRDGNRAVTLRPRSGLDLHVEWSGEPDSPTSAILEGDARFVFEGRLADEACHEPGWS
jgi:diaminopimelate epimerase